MVYYFGGKFNPPTRGHAAAVSAAMREMKPGDSLVIGVQDFKAHDLPDAVEPGADVPWETRMLLVRRMLVDMGVIGVDGKDMQDVRVVVQTSGRTWEFLSSAEWAGDGVTLVLGEDEAGSLRRSATSGNGRWRDAKKIVDKFKILEVPRSDVSSTRAREVFRADPFVLYGAVEHLVCLPVYNEIRDNELYWQRCEAECRVDMALFLESYDASKYRCPSCTATVAAFCGRNVLLVRRGNHPFKGMWSLPGGFMDVDKDMNIEKTAERELQEETGVSYAFHQLDLFAVYSDKGIDPRGRVVDNVFVADFGYNFPEIKAGDDAAEARWWPVDSLPRMAFHHGIVVLDILESQGVARNFEIKGLK